MARSGVGRWPGAREALRDGHRAGPLLLAEKFQSRARCRRRRHLLGFENGGRVSASQSGDNGQLLGNMSPAPLPSLPVARAETGKEGWLEGISLQISELPWI